MNWKRVALTTVFFGGSLFMIRLILWLSDLPAVTWESVRLPAIYFSVCGLGLLCYGLAAATSPLLSEPRRPKWD